MTVHRWFANKACPGDYLYNKHGEIAATVNARLNPPVPQEKEEEQMTQEQFNQMMNNYLAELAQQPPSDWSEQDRKFCETNGIIKGDTNGDKRYKSFVTREELATIIHRIMA